MVGHPMYEMWLFVELLSLLVEMLLFVGLLLTELWWVEILSFEMLLTGILLVEMLSLDQKLLVEMLLLV